MDRSKQMETLTSPLLLIINSAPLALVVVAFGPVGVPSHNVQHSPHSARRRPTTSATTNMTDKNSTAQLRMRKEDQGETCEN